LFAANCGRTPQRTQKENHKEHKVEAQLHEFVPIVQNRACNDKQTICAIQKSCLPICHEGLSVQIFHKLQNIVVKNSKIETMGWLTFCQTKFLSAKMNSLCMLSNGIATKRLEPKDSFSVPPPEDKDHQFL